MLPGHKVSVASRKLDHIVPEVVRVPHHLPVSWVLHTRLFDPAIHGGFPLKYETKNFNFKDVSMNLPQLEGSGDISYRNIRLDARQNFILCVLRII